MLDFSSLSKTKLIFFAVTGVLLLAIIVGISMLRGSAPDPLKTSAPKELTVWIVGDETSGFSEIITGFKNRYPVYKNTDIKVTKFGNYVDYEKTLLTVLSDGNSPDIFMVNSSDGGLLESKILAIPSDIMNPDEFSKNFNKVFDDLIVENKEKDASGGDKTTAGIKGIPLGYQAMGVFYNWKLVRTIPHLWSEIGGVLEVSTDETESPDHVEIMLGINSRYIPGAPDILSLFFLQNNTPSYVKFSDGNANKAIDSYTSFSGKVSQNTLTQILSSMKDLNLSTVDMFVRGKIGMIIGYPSLLREIEYSIKRAGSENVLTSKTLRTSEIPQTSLDPKDALNLADYNYFALSKLSPNMQAGYSFLSYLATGEAEEKYLKNFPLYLPAQRLREESKINEAMSSEYDRVKYRSFMNPDTTLQVFEKGLKNEYDAYFMQILNDVPKEAKVILSGAVKYIDCNKKHLINQTSLEEECKIE